MALLLVVECVLLWCLLQIQRRVSALNAYECLVASFVFCAGFQCLLTEALSLMDWLVPHTLIRFHVIVVSALACLLVYYSRARSRVPKNAECSAELYVSDGIATGGCIALAVFLSIPAILSASFAPPSNWDSMTYHLPRVMRWLSQGSLEHYATYVARQVYLNPGHEFLLAQAIGLGGSDHYAGLLNSGGFFIAMVAAAGIVKRLGGEGIAQAVSVILLGTIPMGVLQASTTQNDLLMGTYILAALLAMLMVQQERGVLPHLLMWCGIGLAILTKGLALLWIPAVATVAFPYRRFFSLQGIVQVFSGISIVLLLNIGHWSRNLSSFGHPLGPTTGPITLADYSVEGISVGTIVSNILRTLALHSNVPFFDVGSIILSKVVWLHSFLGVGLSESATTLVGTRFEMLDPARIHEDLAGNGSHAVLMAFATALWGYHFLSRRYVLASRGVPIIAALLGFLIMAALVRWQPWASRLQLPLFMVAAPGCAAILCACSRVTLGSAVAIATVCVAWPYWFHNELRPLIGERSILFGDEGAERFYAQPALYSEFVDAADDLRSIGCQQIGLINREDDWEHGLFVQHGLNVKVRSCRAPQQYGRHLWLAHRKIKKSMPCALVWFGGDVPEKVTSCGRGYKRMRDARQVNVMLPREYQ